MKYYVSPKTRKHLLLAFLVPIGIYCIIKGIQDIIAAFTVLNQTR
jgi:hypothetical protein